MFSKPSKYEIDHQTIKLIVGVIAISLGNVTSFLSGATITSISEAYYADSWARNVLVGFLFAISAFLLAYNGESRREMILSKIAAVAAIGVAMFPCACDLHEEIIPYVHYVSAAVMFSVLAAFCLIFYWRAVKKGHREALWRARIYTICFLLILGSMATIAFDYFSNDALTAIVNRLTYYCERAGLIAFGVSWLTASRVLPIITSKSERFSPFN